MGVGVTYEFSLNDGQIPTPDGGGPLAHLISSTIAQTMFEAQMLQKKLELSDLGNDCCTHTTHHCLLCLFYTKVGSFLQEETEFDANYPWIQTFSKQVARCVDGLLLRRGQNRVTGRLFL